MQITETSTSSITKLEISITPLLVFNLFNYDEGKKKERKNETQTWKYIFRYLF